MSTTTLQTAIAESPGSKMTDGINTLRYSDFFLAMYFDGGKSCLHRNHSHVLVYMYSGEMVIDERGEITRGCIKAIVPLSERISVYK